MDAGARDVGINPRIMKRGRPGFTISALCEEADLQDVLLHSSCILPPSVCGIIRSGASSCQGINTG